MQPNLRTIRKLTKKILTLTFAFIALLPIALQSAHAFEKHEYSVYNSSISFETENESETECSIFHYKINYNSFSLGSVVSLNETTISKQKIVSFESILNSTQLTKKSSRAPPIS